MASASVPPWEPTPSCRIAAVRVAISPSLSAGSRLDTLSQILHHLDGSDLFRTGCTLVVSDAFFLDICGDFLRFCERSNPLVIVKYFRGSTSL